VKLGFRFYEDPVPMDTIRYWLGLLLVIGLPPGIAWWFFVHPFVGFWRRFGPRLTMVVMAVFFIVSVSALFSVRGVLMGRDLGTSPLLVTVGIVLCGAGAYVSHERRKYLTVGILAGVPEVQTDEERRGALLDQGPYAIIRHPRYVEILLFTWGYAAVSNYVGPYVLAGLTFPLLHLVVLLEERELGDRFGDAYREYCQRVPRYIPQRSGPRRDAGAD
jgi:protein-S-isoprenylcysteine O-methyltransferase Ste14